MFEIKLPSNPSMRLCKFNLEGDRWINLCIGNEKRLKKMIDRYNPKNIYFSKSLYLNAKNIERTTYKKRIIKTELVFDLDNVSPEEPLKVLELMQPHKPIYILQTSQNNYQINYGFIKIKKERYEKIKNECEIDYPITEDDFRVVRIVNSHNGNKDFTTMIISKQDIVCRLESLKDNDQVNNLQSRKIEVVETQTNPPSYFKSKFLSNKIGKNKYVFFVKLKYLNENQLKRFQEIYKMDLFIIDYGNYYGVVSNKILNKIRLRKCLKFFNKDMKFRQIFIRCSGYLYPNKIINKPKRIGFMSCSNEYPYSKYHNHFLNHIGFDISLDKKEPLIYETKFKEVNK